MFEIEKDVPLVKREYKGGRETLFPFKDMQINDSFLVPAGEGDRKTRMAVSAAANYYGRRYSTTYAVRAVEGGVRVWRVK